MLAHLVIRNFAIIHHLEVPFSRGLTVLTGETGAGKSIVIDALNLLLGGRATTDVIRSEEDQAVVEGVFELDEPQQDRINALLIELGIEACDHELVVRRIVSRSGRNKVFVNGCLTTLTTLQSITRGLVDISGQHEHISLLDAQRHLDILDEFAVLKELRDEMARRFDAVRKLRTELEGLRGSVRDRLHRIDFLRYQLSEIEAARLTVGEDEALELEFSRLKNASKLGDVTVKATQLVYEGESSAISRLSEAASVLGKIAHVDPALTALTERLNEARYALEDVARELSDFGDQIEANPARLDSVQERLEVIKHLKRKHGVDLNSVLSEAASMREELNRLENAEERGAELEAALGKAEGHAMEWARHLSGERREAAALFARSIETELRDLNMKGTTLAVSFDPQTLADPRPHMLSARGIDTVEFLLSPNPGEAAKQLSRIASGGELSRIMLAMKTVLAERDSISTYIFDEVDSGIGGSTADQVGAKIARTAADHQVICITHLAQIASRGQNHYRVEKHVSADRTESVLRLLTPAERVEEIARMLGGTRVTDKTREAAMELLEEV